LRGYGGALVTPQNIAARKIALNTCSTHAAVEKKELLYNAPLPVNPACGIFCNMPGKKMYTTFCQNCCYTFGSQINKTVSPLRT
jgi:hypothetical protein